MTCSTLYECSLILDFDNELTNSFVSKIEIYVYMEYFSSSRNLTVEIDDDGYQYPLIVAKNWESVGT